jgi:hypothetical protein
LNALHVDPDVLNVSVVREKDGEFVKTKIDQSYVPTYSEAMWAKTKIQDILVSQYDEYESLLRNTVSGIGEHLNKLDLAPGCKWVKEYDGRYPTSEVFSLYLPILVGDEVVVDVKTKISVAATPIVMDGSIRHRYTLLVKGYVSDCPLIRHFLVRKFLEQLPGKLNLFLSKPSNSQSFDLDRGIASIPLEFSDETTLDSDDFDIVHHVTSPRFWLPASITGFILNNRIKLSAIKKINYVTRVDAEYEVFGTPVNESRTSTEVQYFYFAKLNEE